MSTALFLLLLYIWIFKVPHGRRCTCCRRYEYKAGIHY